MRTDTLIKKEEVEEEEWNRREGNVSDCTVLTKTTAAAAATKQAPLK